jgi:ankyrin repeat protein
MVDVLLSKSEDTTLVNTPVEYKWDARPLHVAAYFSRPDIVRLLLDRGAQIEAKQRYVSQNKTTPPSLTALHVAAARGNCAEVVKLLLKKGANVTARDNFDQTPLHLAASSSNTDIVELLLANGALNEAKARYANENPQFNETDVVELLLANGAPIEAKARHDNGMSSSPYQAYVPEDEQPSVTPLLLVSDYNYYEMVKLLLEKGANVSARNSKGTTPLHNAVLMNHMSIVELLLAKGADINAVADDGNTPLHWAALTPGATSELLEFLLTRPENATSTNLVKCDSTVHK